VGGNNQQTNISVVRTICALLDEMQPKSTPYADQITYVTDRPGHDRRYAIDARKIQRELKWFPAQDFTSGLRLTVRWYLDNQAWAENVTSGAYREWISKNYASRAEVTA
jgi:dTDP-glucose 4,6-dehydratase